MRHKNPRRYAALLKLRKRQQDMKSGEMADSTRELHNAQAYQGELMQYQRQMLEHSHKAEGELDASEIRASHQFGRYLSDRIVEQDAQIQTLKHKVSLTRSELEDTMKDRRIVEKIMSNAMDVVTDHRQKAEQREHDEVASIRSALTRLERRKNLVNKNG